MKLQCRICVSNYLIRKHLANSQIENLSQVYKPVTIFLVLPVGLTRLDFLQSVFILFLIPDAVPLSLDYTAFAHVFCSVNITA